MKTTTTEVLFKCKFETQLDIIQPNFVTEKEKYKDDNIDKFKDYDFKSFNLGQAVFAKTLMLIQKIIASRQNY